MVGLQKIVAARAVVELSLEAKQALQQIQAVGKQMEQMLQKVHRPIDQLSSAFLKLGAAFSGAVAAAVTFGDATAKMAQRLGLSTEELTAFRYAAESLGASGQNMDEALRIMTRRIGEFQSGTGEAQKAFEALGITVEALSGKSAAEQFELIRDRLSQVESSTQRAALAAKIFDTNWAPLAPLLAMTGQEFQGLIEQADQAGQVLDSKVARQSEEVAQAVGEMTTSLKLVTVQIGAALLPLMKRLRDILVAVSSHLQRLGPVGLTLVRVFGLVTIAVGAITVAMKGLAAAIALVKSTMGVWGLAITGIITGLMLLWEAVKYFTGGTEEAAEKTVDFSKSLEAADAAGRRLGRSLEQNVARALQRVNRELNPAIERIDKLFQRLDRFNEDSARDVAELLVELERLKEQVGQQEFAAALHRAGIREEAIRTDETGRLNASARQIQAALVDLSETLRRRRAFAGFKEIDQLGEEMVRRGRQLATLEARLPEPIRRIRSPQAKVDFSDPAMKRAILDAWSLVVHQLPTEAIREEGRVSNRAGFGSQEHLEVMLKHIISYRARLRAEHEAASRAWRNARDAQDRRIRAEEEYVRRLRQRLHDRRRVDELERRFEQARFRRQRLAQDRQKAAQIGRQLEERLQQERLKRLPRHEQQRIRAQQEFARTVRQISRLQISRQQREALIQRAQAVLAERLRQIQQEQRQRNQAPPHPAVQNFLNQFNQLLRAWWQANRDRLRNLPRAVRQRHILWARVLAFERVFHRFGTTQAAVLSGAGAAALAGRMGRARDNPLWEMLDVLRQIAGLAGLQEGHLRFIRKKALQRFR